MARSRSRRGAAMRRGRRFLAGWRDGYPLGWQHGHWYGRCEAVVQASLPPAVRRPIRVLYVTTGKGYPYTAIDEGMVQTLQTMVDRLIVANPLNQDVRAVALKTRPHLMIVLDGMNMPPEQVLKIRDAGIRAAIWFTDDPYYTDLTAQLAPYYDFVFTLERNCVPLYAQLGCRAFHLPLGVLPQAFRPRNPPLELRGDFCFVGTAYWNRVGLFHALLPMVAHRRFRLSGMWWERLPDYRRWRDRIGPGSWMPPAQTAAFYNAHKLVINVHRAHDDPTFNRNSAGIRAISPNPRTFEIAACGTLQLTDWRDDLAFYYVPGVEIATYTSPEDLALKIEYYLEHEEERQHMALLALKRTMRDHTYISRLSLLLDIVMPG
jgi:spore maturation protein CgeB